jgi:hypothetical protein
MKNYLQGVLTQKTYRVTLILQSIGQPERVTRIDASGRAGCSGGKTSRMYIEGESALCVRVRQVTCRIVRVYKAPAEPSDGGASVILFRLR